MGRNRFWLPDPRLAEVINAPHDSGLQGGPGSLFPAKHLVGFLNVSLNWRTPNDESKS
jgi:hypothetical protein